MINKFLNTAMWFITRRKTRQYKSYPNKTTALLLVNCQFPFLQDKLLLKNNISAIKGLAKKLEWEAIFTKYIPSSKKHLTPIHSFLNTEYEKEKDDCFPEKIASDIVMPATGAISAFSNSNLLKTLKEKSIEHLIIVGPYADLTIDSTMRDGVQHDFHITIVSDCTQMSHKNSDYQTYQLTMQRYAHEILTIEELSKLARS